MATTEEDLAAIEAKAKALEHAYEQYFLGSQPREPRLLRDEVELLLHQQVATPLANTALRFRFNSLQSRFQACKRRWDKTLREIESGTYQRHLFKARLHEGERTIAASGARQCRRDTPAARSRGLFEDYRDAALACGQDIAGLTPEKLERVVARQAQAARKRLGCDEVDFTIVADGGRVKLRVSARR